jgi:hypothetical protein
MARWQPVAGIGLGLLAAAVVAGIVSSRRVVATEGPMLPDCGGKMKSAVMQYAGGSQFVLPVYKKFLSECPAEVEIILACPDAAALEEMKGGVGPIRQKVTPVFTGHTMTAWSRDRWVALLPREAGKATTLLSPAVNGDPVAWPQRFGDCQVGSDLGKALAPRVAARFSKLLFDGGDFLADGGRVYFTEAVVERNLQHTVESRDVLMRTLTSDLGLTPKMLVGAPPHHAGMYMMAAGNNTMVVADAKLGAKYLAQMSPELMELLPNGPDLSDASAKKFDAVAEQLAADGYKVVRIPVIPDVPARVYVTYVNVILDGAREAGGKPTCYLPNFRGAEAMNEAAVGVWEGLGYRVVTIDCTDVFTKGGTLHCLVNVMERE